MRRTAVRIVSEDLNFGVHFAQLDWSSNPPLPSRLAASYRPGSPEHNAALLAYMRAIGEWLVAQSRKPDTRVAAIEYTYRTESE